MYHGAMPEQGDDDDDMLHLSYVRCRHYPDHREETSPLTLNPTLLWASHTRLAPSRTLLRDETTLARAEHEAQLEHTYTSGGYNKGEWSRLYSHAMSVLPLFDAGSIPSNLVVDGLTGRCFLVRALVHPDDSVAAAAARSLQQIMCLHPGLRVPVFKAMLSLLGRIPPSDVAVQATLLGQFCHLSEVRAHYCPAPAAGPRCNPTQPGCNPTPPRCNPTHPGCNPMYPGVDRAARAAGPVQPGQRRDARAGGALPMPHGVRGAHRLAPPAGLGPPPRAAAPHHDALAGACAAGLTRAYGRYDQWRDPAQSHRRSRAVAQA